MGEIWETERKKKEQMQRDKRRQEGEVRKGKGQKEIERKAEQFAYKRTHARTSFEGRGDGGGGMASRRTANARAPGCSCEEFPSREKLDYLLEGRQQGFTHLLVLAFVLKHHHPILIQHCLGRHFFNNQFPCSRKSMYAGTRLLLVRYREMYIASSR